MFESYVILDTTKTNFYHYANYEGFESYVILDTTKTYIQREHQDRLFESYVILDTTKTEGIIRDFTYIV